MSQRELKIATANSRLATRWDNNLINWPGLTERLANAHIGHDTVDQYHHLPKTKRDDLKDVGGFVGGHLAQGRRRKGHVLARSLIALDLDTPPVGLIDELPGLLDYEWAVYSTHSHTPGQPRLRLIVPLARDVDAEEYAAVARRIAADIGIDYFDDTTYEPHRLMYWPSHPIDGEYIYQEHKGDWLNPDATLARFDNWRDISTWPTSSRQAEALKHTADRQADPLAKPGLVGAFCRTYTIQHAIETHLPEIYTPETGGRYTYAAGESSSGAVIYDDKFLYSHHGTDPAGGQLVNAFDLVRIHKFGTWDEDAKAGTPTHKLPSSKAMNELAQSDKATKATLATELVSASDEFTPVDDEGKPTTAAEWIADLELDAKGRIAETLDNLAIILTHDEKLQEIRFNELAGTIDVRNPKKLPWVQVKPGWTDTDIAQLKLYLERKYHLYSSARTAEALTIGAAGRAYHPIRDYLEALPQWDQVPRVDTLLIDYLGAEDSAYTRAVMRKTLVAAITRIYRPGAKFDTVLILNGPQGTGKSTLFAKLGGQWFSDALTITDMRDKTGAEKLQNYWIHEMGELAGMRKVEVEVVKGFLSRTDDKYRAAYSRTVESHPRQCIIVGSTNAENGFLRDVTGNRRFWPVAVTGTEDSHSWNLDADTVDQIWAEALAAYKADEPLHLTGKVAEQARAHQDGAIETDDRVGMVEEYLNTDLPHGWWEMNTHQRIQYLGGGGTDDFGAAGDDPDQPLTRREKVSNAEIWAECFRKDVADMRPADSYAIAAIMQKIDGWEKATGSGSFARVFPYGKQRVYRRVTDEQPPF